MNTTKAKENTATIRWDENGQPHSLHFDDVYFSKENGLLESEYVFLKGNALAERFHSLPEKGVFRIAETGFGTGLNFLSTWQLWQKTVQHGANLEFISVEKYPLTKEALTQALALWPELAAFSEPLLAAYSPQPWQAVQRLNFDDACGSHIRLTIYYCGLEEALNELNPCAAEAIDTRRSAASLGEQRPHIDAWFLDGFAPSKNPEMWTQSLYESMALNSTDRSTFTTFTSAGSVRRGLEAQGFSCKKIAGFGRKREMLTGYFSHRSDAHPIGKAPLRSSGKTQETPTQFATWLLQRKGTPPAPPSKAAKSAIIIGAGLAGAHLAFALSQRGLNVTVIEKNTAASGASSNFQGAVYTRLSGRPDPLSVFNRHAQGYADAFYKQHGFYDRCGASCGVLHLSTSDKDRERLRRFAADFGDATAFEFLSREQASDYAHFALQHDALLVRNSGWLHPAELCRQLLQHRAISLVENTQVYSLEYVQGQWTAHTDHTDIRADLCIVCNAQDALAFEQSAHLPIKSIRGQVTHCMAEGALADLRAVICGEGYLCPQAEWQGEALQSVGATFNLKDESHELNDADHHRNLQSLSRISKSTSLAEVSQIATRFPGKVGFRSTSPDYFPMLGPLPVLSELQREFALLSKKANALIDSAASHYPGLYCSLAYGSRGLAYAPLCSALMADLITGSYLPVSRSLYAYLHPARFAIRALMKNQSYSPATLLYSKEE